MPITRSSRRDPGDLGDRPDGSRPAGAGRAACSCSTPLAVLPSGYVSSRPGDEARFRSCSRSDRAVLPLARQPEASAVTSTAPGRGGPTCSRSRSGPPMAARTTSWSRATSRTWSARVPGVLPALAAALPGGRRERRAHLRLRLRRDPSNVGDRAAVRRHRRQVAAAGRAEGSWRARPRRATGAR